MPTDAGAPHEPVMVGRVVALLARPSADGGVLVDATIGAAGHAAALLAASSPSVHLLGFDRDPDALVLAGRRLTAYGDRVELVHAGYDELAAHVGRLRERHGPVLGVLYDLGVSSMQVDRGERGFSFRVEGPLDMRMDPTTGRTAADLIASCDVAELADILRRYGEERYAGRIARAIVRARPATTTALAEAVASAVPTPARHTGTHPATRTFQALRIAVNDELGRFSASLPQALEVVAPPAGDEPGGRVATLTYHSLEDRIAKRVLSDAATGCICPPDLPVCGCGRVPLVRHLFRRVERPDAEEVARNPRARSAKLRAVEKRDPE